MKTGVILHGVTNMYGNNTNAHEVLSWTYLDDLSYNQGCII